ncbi:hypothetical protein [Nonomuraea insulae]|uniref:Uncharacterized protein n=1 Tax=Nonomuraea insulae TaxID=1616787 RepID=A0ABW1CEB8_9ACTN
MLGTPTERDLRRYATAPSFLDRPATGVRPPRAPLSVSDRRRLTRWGAVGLALVLLACGAQALESAVFSEPVVPQPADEIVLRQPIPQWDGAFPPADR